MTILQRKVTEKGELKKTMTPSNKDCKLSFCSNALLLYVNTVYISRPRFSQHHPEHHVTLLHTDKFVEVLLMQWLNLIKAVC